jgi:flagellar biosynthesis/type III secretory pathway M-ring protein FliF/YscJ
MAGWLQTRTQTLGRIWDQCSTRQRLLVMSIAALSIASGGWYLMNNQRELRPLLAGRNLRPDESQRIQIALGQAGLGDFTIKDDTIYVPSHLLATYLKAVAKGDAIPEDILHSENRPPELSFLMTRQQQDAMLLYRKKQELTSLIRKLPFVEQAWVEVDVNSGQTAFQKRQTSCVVSVQPQQHSPLSREQIHSIRRMATGAIAGLDAEQVVVVDMQSGLALTNEPNQSEDQARVNAIAQVLRENHELELAISERLTQFREISVSVSNLRLEIPANSTDAESPRGMVLPQALVGTTGRAMTVNSSGNAPRRASESSAKRVRIEIPESSLKKSVTDGRNKSVRFDFEETKREVKKMVESIMVNRQLDPNEAQVEILLSAHPSPQSAQGSVSDLLGSVQGRYPGAAIATVSGLLLCLILVLSTRRKPQRKSRNDRVASDDGAAHPDQEVRESIDRLIQNDPAAVAQVLQEWIRKAS